MANGTSSFTLAVFSGGAIGGVALDVLSLYFTGFPEGHGLLWHFGKLITILLFMALTGFLACVFANGQLKTAFVIGVAAPSILLNIVASTQKSGDRVPVLPSIPAAGAKLGAVPKAPSPWDLLGPSVAEAQETAPSVSTFGLVKVSIGKPPSGIDALKDGQLYVFDATGKLVFRAVPPSQTFVVAIPKGKYTFKYSTPKLLSSQMAVTIDDREISEVALPVTPLKEDSSSWVGWADFLSGAGSQFKKVNAANWEKTQAKGF